MTGARRERLHSRRNARSARPSSAISARGLVLTAVVLLLTNPAMAQSCRLRLTDLPRVEPQSGYDPFASAPPPEYDRVTVRHNSGGGCSFAVGFNEGANGRRRAEYNGSYLSYQLFRDASLTTALTDASGSPGGLLSGYADSKIGDVSFDFYSVFPGGQIGPGGTYRDSLTLTVYELSGGVPGRVLDTRTVQVRARMLETVQASVQIGGGSVPLSGSTSILNLGTLVTGSRGDFSVVVSGNAEYDLRLESENKGRLSGGSGSIPYSVAINGQGVAMSSAVTLQYGGIGTRTHAIGVTIGDVGNALAGTYSDNLSLTITAR
jgi:spore coat protein U-like protein